MEYYFFRDDYPDYDARLEAMSLQVMAWDKYCNLALVPKE